MQWSFEKWNYLIKLPLFRIIEENAGKAAVLKHATFYWPMLYQNAILLQTICISNKAQIQSLVAFLQVSYVLSIVMLVVVMFGIREAVLIEDPDVHLHIDELNHKNDSKIYNRVASRHSVIMVTFYSQWFILNCSCVGGRKWFRYSWNTPPSSQNASI